MVKVLTVSLLEMLYLVLVTLTVYPSLNHATVGEGGGWLPSYTHVRTALEPRVTTRLALTEAIVGIAEGEATTNDKLHHITESQ